MPPHPNTWRSKGEKKRTTTHDQPSRNGNYSNAERGYVMSENTDSQPPAKGQVLIYPAENGRLEIEVPLENETVWLKSNVSATMAQTL